METNAEGNLLEIMDLARTLRQEQLFIQQEQNSFAQLTETLSQNSISITKLAYICAQQRRNLNDLIVSRPEVGPSLCCRRARNYDVVTFVDAKKIFDYQHVLGYEELFNFLYHSPYLLAVSLATGDRLPDIPQQHMASVTRTVSTGLFGNAINTKDVEMMLKLLRELIEIQIVVGDDSPKRLLRPNASSFARLYHNMIESTFSAKIFLTATLFQPIMEVLSDNETVLDVDPIKVIQSLSSKEKIKLFGEENSSDYWENIDKFHAETIEKLYKISKTFIDSLLGNWSLFPSTLRWLVQTMCHQLKQAHHFSDQVINEIVTDMVFTHFICPAIISPDILGIVDAPISEQIRFNLMQIAQVVQTLALAKYDDVDAKFVAVHTKFQSNMVTKLIDLLLENQSGEDVVAILAQQSEFERIHLLITQNDLNHFIEFFRILTINDEYEISDDEKKKLKKILSHIPENFSLNNSFENGQTTGGDNGSAREKTKPSLINLSKATKSKLAKSITLNHGNVNGHINPSETVPNGLNGQNCQMNGLDGLMLSSRNNSTNSSPVRLPMADHSINESILIFNFYSGVENKMQPLSEEEVLKMNSIGQEIANGDLVDSENYQVESTVDKSSVVNGFDGMDGMSDVLRTQHNKNSRFSLSHDDASIGNSDNLEVVSEVPSNHSVTSSLELEENDQNDNLSDMVSANVSGRGTPNISGRDTPSSQVTDGESLNNALPTPQMQKLISKARSDIEDKFCKFEIKKFEGDETVSIISDTWSTDVICASDSETVDAESRDRERNFSTPLIPAAVVLPGDNNFDVLTGAGGMRSGYLDASDQRSESNWSTDVLASDSEKLNEVDTDDNISIAARSDTADGCVRYVHERDQLAAAISAPCVRQRSSNTPHYSVARSNRGLRMSNSSTNNYKAATASNRHSDDVQGSGSSGGNASDRSQEDSAFYDAINSYEDNAISGENGSHNYQGVSSLARSCMRTTNQVGGENTFQQNYKSTNNNDEKDSFLTTLRMRRQTSAESSISNQSLSLEETNACKISSNQHLKKKQRNRNTTNYESKDLIDFSDFCDDKDLTPPSMPPPAPPTIDIFSDDIVEHRGVSTERRSAGFDGRRNGIMALRGGCEVSANGNLNITSSLRKHQSLNYENHEIMIRATVHKRVSVLPNLSPNSLQTDDDKRSQYQEQVQENSEPELLLCAKISQMQLNNSKSPDTLDNAQHELSRNTPTNNGHNVSISGIMTSSVMSNQKPSKSTGAIPKSISFDASADKSSANNFNSANRQRNTRLQDAVRHTNTGTSPAVGMANSGIFNKLKQGIFKHRRGYKSQRQTAIGNPDDISQSSRSVSFSNNTSEVSLDLVTANISTCPMAVTNERTILYYDTNEDILAKYRRKVSTSSEATNSSAGNCGTGNACGDNKINGELQSESQHASLHDKAMVFNILKKKIRTVLSKTDLHSADFRHTTQVNASPLLTYLQIQLAQAVNLQNFQQISYVSEAIRCISSLDVSQHAQLLDELQNDIQKRQSYLQYLMRFRQNLLLIMENIGQYEARLRSESSTCNRYLVAVCMRLFIEKRQDKIDRFQGDFARLTSSDDKIELIEEFIDSLMDELLTTGGILHGMPEWQEVEARAALERILLQRMHQQVMFPNEDADLSRDSFLYELIRKLQNVITPSHPTLCIPQEYLSEAPWSFAQQQLSYITAYKTPREKLKCVIRCNSSIMSLLHMSSGRAPAADDVLPVLIYVVIMANPPFLLSTVEYITCFIGEKLDGEEQFHWTLFDSVVKFIKTMEYLVQ
uniref:Receptor-mediated endocytosis protein 6 homolog n=1 Tax=Glossina morsitans morsitans TaxID=37546 RepID=A0A1B0FH28_GLOMM